MIENNCFTVDTLVLEVTRRCNMACKHCLRGPAENIDMTKDLVDKTFENIHNVRNIVFTGGEPFLNVDIIEYALKVVKEKNILVYSLFIATNAKMFEERYITILNDWMFYVASCNYGTGILDANSYLPNNEDLFQYGGVAISRDKFHEPIPMENYIRYRMLSYYLDSKEHNKDEFDYILDEGNASINGIGNHKPIKNEISLDYSIQDAENDDFIISDLVVDSILYINAKGDVLGDCDTSFKNQEEISIGNIYDNTLISIIEQLVLAQEDTLEEVI